MSPVARSRNWETQTWRRPSDSRTERRSGNEEAIDAEGHSAAARSAAQQGGGLFAAENATGSACAACCPARADHRGAGRPGAGAPAVEGRRPGEVHRPGRPPGPQRDALLPRAGREPRGAAAHRLHADRGPGLPAVQPHLPAAARHLDHAGRRGPHPGPAAQRPHPGHPADRGHRQRADPGPGRPGGGRHGHSRRQAVALHAPRPASIPGTACRSASTWARTTPSC